MDKNQLVSKLDKVLPGAVLELRRFGRSDMPSVWVEAQAILKISEILKTDPDLRFDWLENLSVVEFEKVLVMSYFIRSYSSDQSLVVRVSVVPLGDTREIHVPSICPIWPMGEPMEREIQELFGIRFLGISNEATLLPPGWVGFPLRKNYIFPNKNRGTQ